MRVSVLRFDGRMIRVEWQATKGDHGEIWLDIDLIADCETGEDVKLTDRQHEELQTLLMDWADAHR